ncbi:GMC oxidoreductase [Streptomyces sp. NPDC002668]|uniref:GMC oxidoreductase n=1 Tax=Streptomyces sp. NPDC002668 TaxID=3154422 RepID=UPI003330AC27
MRASDATRMSQPRAFLGQAAGSDFHPVGGCAMGVGPDALVAPDLTVHGIAGQQVVDASVMPAIVSVDTSAAAAMIAEKGADLIRRT